MKTRTLILMRHGKAEKEGLSDHERELTDRGLEQATTAGKFLRKQFGQVERSIVSDATRTRQTVAGVLRTTPIQRVIFEPKLYTINNQKEFCSAISQHLSNVEKTLLIIGHNPSISFLASYYTAQDFDLGTGEFVIANIEASDWQTALESTGCWTVRYPQ